jgi:hypothetical protein
MHLPVSLPHTYRWSEIVGVNIGINHRIIQLSPDGSRRRVFQAAILNHVFSPKSTSFAIGQLGAAQGDLVNLSQPPPTRRGALSLTPLPYEGRSRGLGLPINTKKHLRQYQLRLFALSGETISRTAQAQVFPQRTALVGGPEQPAFLQHRDHQVDKII